MKQNLRNKPENQTQNLTSVQSSIKPLELSQEELEKIAGGAQNEPPPPAISANHNETSVAVKNLEQSEKAGLIVLSSADLENISGAGITINHNETMVEAKV